jgi:hypothetical protein
MPQIKNAYNSKGLRRMLGHDLQWWVDWANTAYIWALIAGAIAALAIAGTSFFLIRWQAEIQAQKDAAFEKYKIDAAREIATLETKTAEAQSQLALIEQMSAHRPIVNPEGFLELLESAPKGSVEIVYAQGDDRALWLKNQLQPLLQEAKWGISDVRRVPPSELWKGSTLVGGATIPLKTIVSASVGVVVRSFTEEEKMSMINLGLSLPPDLSKRVVPGRPSFPFKTPFTLIAGALMRGLGRGVSVGTDESLPEGIVRIIIGSPTTP